MKLKYFFLICTLSLSAELAHGQTYTKPTQGTENLSNAQRVTKVTDAAIAGTVPAKKIPKPVRELKQNEASFSVISSDPSVAPRTEITHITFVPAASATGPAKEIKINSTAKFTPSVNEKELNK